MSCHRPLAVPRRAFRADLFLVEGPPCGVATIASCRFRTRSTYSTSSSSVTLVSPPLQNMVEDIRTGLTLDACYDTGRNFVSGTFSWLKYFGEHY